MLASGHTHWSVGDRVRVYRTRAGEGRVVDSDDDVDIERRDTHDYDVEHYVRVLRENFASRLARAFAPGDFDSLFSDPEQPSLFPPAFETMRPTLTINSYSRSAAAG
jgi:hypothetical protein